MKQHIFLETCIFCHSECYFRCPHKQLHILSASDIYEVVSFYELPCRRGVQVGVAAGGQDPPLDRQAPRILREHCPPVDFFILNLTDGNCSSGGGVVLFFIIFFSTFHSIFLMAWRTGGVRPLVVGPLLFLPISFRNKKWGKLCVPMWPMTCTSFHTMSF